MHKRSRATSGQSTVEYAIVLFAFLAMVVALGSIWRAAQSGRIQSMARSSASHSLDQGLSIDFLQDVTAY